MCAVAVVGMVRAEWSGGSIPAGHKLWQLNKTLEKQIEAGEWPADGGCTYLDEMPSQEVFLKDYLGKRRPFVVKNGIRYYDPKIKNWGSLDYIEKHYGHHQHVISLFGEQEGNPTTRSNFPSGRRHTVYPSNLMENPYHTREPWSLTEVIKHMREQTRTVVVEQSPIYMDRDRGGRDDRGGGADQSVIHPEAFADVGMPEISKQFKLGTVNMWMGNFITKVRGLQCNVCGTVNHQGASHSALPSTHQLHQQGPHRATSSCVRACVRACVLLHRVCV
jgi:hypothetical protein